MANFEDGSYSCTPGIALIAKVLAGKCTMNYTRAAVGKGYLGEDESPKTALEPAEYVMDAKIAAITNPVDGECQITVQINSSDVESGFYCTGILLYAADPDEGEVPYTYLVLENGPEWIRPASSAVGKLATFDLIAAVGDVDKVTATIDPDSIVTRSVVEQLIAGATVKRDVTIPAEGWADCVAEETDDEEIAEAEYSGMYLDIAFSDVTEDMVPVTTIWPAYSDVAKGCELCTAARTMDRAVRFYAKQAPSSEIKVTLTLLAASSGAANSAGSSGDSYVLPAATATTLGGVKIGDGLSVASDGTISVDTETLGEDLAADDESVSEALNEIYGTESAE